jgi:RNA polymerase sigma-70 factor (ECF subfamily)
MLIVRKIDASFVWIAGGLLSVLASLAIADDAADAEAKGLDGTWKFVSLTVDGKEAPEEFVQKGRWVIQSKSITFPGPVKGKSTFEVDPSRSPKAMDMTGVDGPGQGKTIECIYKIEGERLTICLPGGKRESPGRPRPLEFSGGEGMSLVVLERVKEK